jgi:hypothetical protein
VNVEWSGSHFKCQQGITEMPQIRVKLESQTDNVKIMKVRTPTARRATWRDRFLEIARQVEGIEARTGAVLAAGLRPRARMGGFASLRRALAPQSRSAS